MRQLFLLECKKTVTGITYWLFVAVITAAFWFNYGDIDREEINNASEPFSLFYNAEDNKYAPEPKGLSDEKGQQEMMLGVTIRLLHCYRQNSYEYYPFGYVKEKVFSEEEQKVVLKYLQELTGMDRAAILGADKNASDLDGIEISGNDAYVAEPGSGSMNEAGKYVFSPDEWEHKENASGAGDEEETGSDFSIQVSYTRFQEIMKKIDGMVGKNSYFSQSLINLYYGGNDLDDAPVTLKQHREFYEKDKITGAFARYYCDSIALEILLFPAFVIAAMMMNDRRHTVTDLIYTKPISGIRLILIRYSAVSAMMLVPVLILPVKSFMVLFQYANAAGNAIDMLAFPKYILGWILPTLLFVSALCLFLFVLTERFFSVLVMGVFWLLFKPSVGKITGGNYGLFDFVIRHNTLKGYGRMMQEFDMLVANRLFITGLAVLFVLFSVWIYQIKRKGGLKFDVWEFIHYRKRKL